MLLHMAMYYIVWRRRYRAVSLDAPMDLLSTRHMMKVIRTIAGESKSGSRMRMVS